MAVWTLKMNIIGKSDVFNFCKTEKLIGFGWGLPDDEKIIHRIKAVDNSQLVSMLLKTCSQKILFGHWVTPKIATTYVKSLGSINT